MAVTRERFTKGQTYEQYKAERRNRDAYEATERMITLVEADLVPFRALPTTMDVVVVVTETCPDVIMNLPILDRIARETGKLNPRIFLRDDNKDLMAQYMNGPYESVPVFAFFDPDWQQRAVFIERPRAVTEMRTRKTQEIHEDHPEFGPYGGSAVELDEDARNRLQQAIRQMRVDTAPAYARETIRELGDIARAIGPATTEARWWGNLAAVPA